MWTLLASLAACFGLPLLAVGVILWLCEGSWGKRRGELGSVGVLAWGIALSLPMGYLFLTWALS